MCTSVSAPSKTVQGAVSGIGRLTLAAQTTSYSGESKMCNNKCRLMYYCLVIFRIEKQRVSLEGADPVRSKEPLLLLVVTCKCTNFRKVE